MSYPNTLNCPLSEIHIWYKTSTNFCEYIMRPKRVVSWWLKKGEDEILTIFITMSWHADSPTSAVVPTSPNVANEWLVIYFHVR